MQIITGQELTSNDRQWSFHETNRVNRPIPYPEIHLTCQTSNMKDIMDIAHKILYVSKKLSGESLTLLHPNESGVIKHE